MGEMSIQEAIEELEVLKCMIEWDFSLDYQIAIDLAIEVMRGELYGRCKKED